MDGFLVANGLVSIVTGLALTALILSRRVQEGPVIKLGLIVVTLSMYASAAASLLADSPTRGLVSSAFALRLGLLIVCAGAMARIWPIGGGHPRRRAADFLDPDRKGPAA